MNAVVKLALVVVLQTAALVAIIGNRQWTLATGTPVVLETRPVDPRSLFRGDYVRFTYAIGQLPADLPGVSTGLQHGDVVYVVLQKGDPYWQPVSVLTAPPATAADQIVIKGKVVMAMPPTGSRVGPRVRYGIEDYFVPEGEGRALERPGPNDKVSVQVAVDRFGRAGIQAILVNGEARHTETLF